MRVLSPPLPVALAAAVLAVTAAGCARSSSDAAPPAPAARTSLEIRVSASGRGAPRRYTLRCGPAGGTLPRAADACRRLARVDAPFRPVPPGSTCTQVYGGPAVADVRGRFRGSPVRARFVRTDGCEISRWDKVRFLFPGGLE